MDLHRTLTSLLSGRATYADVSAYVGLCHRFATAYLNQKVAAGHMNPSFFGLDTSDLAVDCISGLFARDGQGTFIRLSEFYGHANWSTLDDTELLVQTRRLIFSRVNQELSRLYKEYDPSLNRILRNLRHAVESCGDFTEERCGGETWISLKGKDARANSLPVMLPEFLMSLLSAKITQTTRLTHLLHELAGVFRGQPSYRPAYPLTELAVVLRKAVVNIGDIGEEGELEELKSMRVEELRRLLDASVAETRQQMVATYVGHKKVSPELYDAYFRALDDMLFAEFIESDGHDRTFFDYLAAHVPDLRREAYRAHHRCHIEYLAKLTRSRFLNAVRRELR